MVVRATNWFESAGFYGVKSTSVLFKLQYFANFKFTTGWRLNAMRAVRHHSGLYKWALHSMYMHNLTSGGDFSPMMD